MIAKKNTLGTHIPCEVFTEPLVYADLSIQVLPRSESKYAFFADFFSHAGHIFCDCQAVVRCQRS